MDGTPALTAHMEVRVTNLSIEEAADCVTVHFLQQIHLWDKDMGGLAGTRSCPVPEISIFLKQTRNVKTNLLSTLSYEHNYSLPGIELNITSQQAFS